MRLRYRLLPHRLFVSTSVPSLTENALTNSSFSLSNNRRCLLRLSRSVAVHQSATRTGPGASSRRQSRAGRRNRRNGVTRCLFSRGAPWHRARLYGRLEVDLCVGSRVSWSDGSHCIGRKVAEH